MKAIIVGCGLSGITSAIILKNKGYDVEIFDSRNHIGGNCYDSNVCGTMVHNYGPHIFHTDDEEVYSFLNRYTEFFPFEYKPLGDTRLGLISLPYSKKTISELGRELSQDEIVEYIFKEYSEKQWGVPFDKIPQSIINRIPKTKDMEDPTWYGNQKYQCMPKYGYTKMMENMLDGIKVNLGADLNDWKKSKSDLVIFTGKIDQYFNFIHGKLPYRSLEFHHTVTGSKQNRVVINQNNSYNKYTRVYDHRYFTYNHKGLTVITKEYPVDHNDNNIPFYPIPFGDGDKIYNNFYKPMADREDRIIFLGRLATYKYLDMWMAIKQVFLRLKNI